MSDGKPWKYWNTHYREAVQIFFLRSDLQPAARYPEMFTPTSLQCLALFNAKVIVILLSTFAT
jgi:hypothetical protein